MFTVGDEAYETISCNSYMDGVTVTVLDHIMLDHIMLDHTYMYVLEANVPSFIFKTRTLGMFSCPIPSLVPFQHKESVVLAICFM